MNVFLEQLGCRLNYGENHLLARQLRMAGHRLVDSAREAHVVVVNTCAVTTMASRKSRQLIRLQHKHNPATRIVATGCYATLEPETAETLPGVWKVASNQDKDLLAGLLETWSSELPDAHTLEMVQPDGVPIAPDDQGRTRAFIKVQDGCNNKCTFCVVTLARGHGRSVDPVQVVNQIRDLCAAGYQEAVLTGVHLGSYGRDLTGSQRCDLSALVHRILAETDIPRLRLSSLEPWDIGDGFFRPWQEWPGRLCPHLHLPLQAGTDHILRRMARRCTVASFRDLVVRARQAIPGLVITTDVIVGFPGETEQDFQDSLAFIREMRFAHAHVFPYSARPGTIAATYPDQVSKREKKERVRRVQALVEATGQQERTGFLGSVRPVLWEGEGQELDDGAGCLWQGYTDNYLRTETVVPDAVCLTNRITPVHLEAVTGQVLLGRIGAPVVTRASNFGATGDKAIVVRSGLSGSSLP